MKSLREWIGDPRVAGALCVLAVLLVGYRFYASGTRNPEPPIPPAPPAAQETMREPDSASAVAAGTAGSSPGKSPSPVRWSWSRNPFLPAETSRPGDGTGGGAAAEGAPKAAGGVADLRGTVIAGRSGIAIFGDRLVPAGGTIDGWTVVRIDPYVVSLRRGGETRRVEMFKSVP
ncbi:MAG: hypothetical protein Kow00128_21720 [Deltaproteobacteria bacterium]